MAFNTKVFCIRLIDEVNRLAAVRGKGIVWLGEKGGGIKEKANLIDGQEYGSHQRKGRVRRGRRG